MTKILVVDDDPEVLGTVWRALSRDGHEVTLAESARQARQHLREDVPDLIILDVIMPGETGLDLCRSVRTNTSLESIPILFLSAKFQTDEIVAGLDAGGDDYITKPFELKELRARVRALLRRVPPGSGNRHMLDVGQVRVNTNTLRARTPHAHDIQLTTTEFRLLYYLMQSPNEAKSVEVLLQDVWGYPSDAGDPDLVRAHIRNLRNKIEKNSRKPEYIQTIHGVGYLFKLTSD